MTMVGDPTGGEVRLRLGTVTWLAVAILAFGPAQTAARDCRMVDVGEHGLHACVHGDAGPVVVLEAGARSMGATWTPLLPHLTDVARVVTYDRAGLGRSDQGRAPRTSAQIAAELVALLDELGLTGPYHLVGHSIGGWHVLHMAEQVPARVASVMLIDTPHPDFEAARSGMLGEEGRAARERLLTESRRELPIGVQREYEGMELTRADWALETLSVPLVVVTAPEHVWGAGDLDGPLEEAWRRLQRAWAEGAPRGRLVTAPGGGHNLHRDVPDFIARLIRELVEADPPA